LKSLGLKVVSSLEMLNTNPVLLSIFVPALLVGERRGEVE